MDGVDLIVVAQILTNFAVLLVAAKLQAKFAAAIAGLVCFVLSVAFCGVMVVKHTGV